MNLLRKIRQRNRTAIAKWMVRTGHKSGVLTIHSADRSAVREYRIVIGKFTVRREMWIDNWPDTRTHVRSKPVPGYWETLMEVSLCDILIWHGTPIWPNHAYCALPGMPDGMFKRSDLRPEKLPKSIRHWVRASDSERQRLIKEAASLLSQ